MSVLPAATPGAGTVIEVDVLVVASPPAPTFLMNAIPGPGPVQPGSDASGGQVGSKPLHASATSHAVAWGRQAVAAG